VKADVTNHAGTAQAGRLSATVQSPTGHTIRVSRSVTVAPGATQTVSFTPSDSRQLLVHHPSVWWPIGMGRHPLYSLHTSLTQSGATPDTESETFGIRSVTTRLIGATPGGTAPDGSRQFLVNGVPFVFRGGGWSEDLFLRYSAADTANQIALIKNLGLNGIRTEGKQMPDDFYEQMDRAGILIDGGYQCCDAWQPATRRARQLGADDRREPARPPERAQLQLERQPSNRITGAGLSRRVCPGRLPGPADLIGRVQHRPGSQWQ
jgi:beta-galactosidase/beta-glucuronidase